MSSSDLNNVQDNDGIGPKLASAAFLAPAAVAGVAIAAAVGSYAPLTYTAPAVAEAAQEVAAAPELKQVDTSDAEKTQAAGLATETDFGIDLSNVKDGTYTGSGTGFSGTITVQVTIQGGKIVAIEIVSSGDDEAYFGQVRGLVDTVIAQQTLNVDTVSGATYSSRGLLSAIKNALLKATGQDPEPLAEAAGATVNSGKAMAAVESTVTAPNGFADGTYEGSAEGYNGPVTVRVTIRGGKIASVDLVSHEDDAQFLWAWAQIPGAIVATQSTNVDTVSGATYSSKGIIAAVQQALKKAAAAAGSKATVPDAGDGSGSEGKKDDAGKKDDSGKSDGADSGKDSDGGTDGSGGASRYEDGNYTGFALCADTEDENFDPYYVAVTIEVKGGKVAGISKIWGTDRTSDTTLADVLNPFDESNQAYLDYAINGRTVKKAWYVGVKAQLLAGVSPSKVDVVSRSTYSSRAIAKAYESALKLAEEAYKKAHPDEGKKDEAADKGDSGKGDSDKGDAGKDDSTTDKDPGKGDSGKDDSGKTDGKDDSGKTDGKDDSGADADDGATRYEDGSYTGFALCSDTEDDTFTPYYVAVTIEVKDGKVAGISNIWGTNQTADASLPEVLDPFDEANQDYLDYAIDGRTFRKVWYEGVKAQLLAGVSPSKVDVVSRSTYSSRAIAKAYESALKLAAEAYRNAHPTAGDQAGEATVDQGTSSDSAGKTGDSTTLADSASGGVPASGGESVDGSGTVGASDDAGGEKGGVTADGADTGSSASEGGPEGSGEAADGGLGAADSAAAAEPSAAAPAAESEAAHE